MSLSRPRPGRQGAAIAVIAIALVLLGAKVGKGGKQMHLGVPPSQVVNIQTFSVPNDNTGGHEFFYDRNSSSPFAVPEGFSFVVTDIFLEPNDFDATSDYLVVVGLDSGESRSFTIRVQDQRELHVPLGGAMIMAGGQSPTARNTPSSTGDTNVRLLGYFVKADALEGGESLFPAP